MRNIALYLKTKKPFNPILMVRYGFGVGDLVTAFLHSKFIGPITYLITGKMEPCHKCSNRRIALNVLFPIPIWRLFFKNLDELNISLNADYKKHGVTFNEEETVRNVPEAPKTEITRISMNDLFNQKS